MKSILIFKSSISDFSGLRNLSCMGGQLTIEHNTYISNVDFLRGLKKLRSLVIKDAPNLQNLNGLSSLNVLLRAGRTYAFIPEGGDYTDEITLSNVGILLSEVYSLTDISGLKNV